MSYETNEALPESVRNTLPAEAQDIWRTVYNSAFEKSKDDAQALKAAWEKTGFEKDPEGTWKKKLAKTHEFDMECFSVGIWNGDPYTEEDLHEMAYAFHELKDKVKPPVTLGHENKMHLKDGQPALGWVKDLKKVGNKLIATLVDVPEILYKAIRANLYKRVSSVIYWNLKETGRTFKRVLAEVGILGTDIPAVTNLADLEAFLSLTPEKGTFDKMATYAFDVNEGGEIQEKEDIDMSAEEIKRLTNELTTAKEALQTATNENKTYKAEAEALKQEKSEGLKTARTEEIKSFCEEKVTAGTMTPAARDILIKDMDTHAYTDEGGFAIRFDAFKKCIETHAKVFEITEKGQEGQDKDKDKKEYTNVSEELTATVKKYMADHTDVNYSEASGAVFAADPDLAKRYRDEDL